MGRKQQMEVGVAESRWQGSGEGNEMARGWGGMGIVEVEVQAWDRWRAHQRCLVLAESVPACAALHGGSGTKPVQTKKKRENAHCELYSQDKGFLLH